MFTNDALMEESERLRKFAFRLTTNMSDAEDLLHSTILRALEKKHLFTDGTNLYGWMSKMMFNLFVSSYRRKVKFETQYDPDHFIQYESEQGKQEISMEIDDVNRAMNRLSDDHREILVMVCVKGLSYPEVSEMLRIPVGTVRSRLSRAREHLRAEMDSPDTAALAARAAQSAMAAA